VCVCVGCGVAVVEISYPSRFRRFEGVEIFLLLRVVAEILGLEICSKPPPRVCTYCSDCVCVCVCVCVHACVRVCVCRCDCEAVVTGVTV